MRPSTSSSALFVAALIALVATSFDESYARSAGATNASKTGAVKTTSSPRDPQSGLPTGQRMHKPFITRRR